MQSIKILGEVYEFKNKRYNINENNYFTIDCVNFINNNQINIHCLLKSINGCIDNTEFNYKSLLKELQLNLYSHYQENVKFVNECSLKYNNKSWFNFITEEQDAIASCSPIPSRFLNLETNKVNIEELNKTCIIKPYTKYENYEVVPIYQYHGSSKDKQFKLFVVLKLLLIFFQKDSLHSSFRFTIYVLLNFK